MEHRVPLDAGLEVGQLIDRGKVAIDEQVGDLEVRRLLGQLLDGVPAIPKDALVAIDIRDSR